VSCDSVASSFPSSHLQLLSSSRIGSFSQRTNIQDSQATYIKSSTGVIHLKPHKMTAPRPTSSPCTDDRHLLLTSHNLCLLLTYCRYVYRAASLMAGSKPARSTCTLCNAMRNVFVWIDRCLSPELACHRAHRLGKAVLKAGGQRLSLNYMIRHDHM
jgi:hypothetical protein